MSHSYSMEVHRAGVREQLIRLVIEGGPGWDDYVRAEASRYRREDPTLHGDLPAEVEEAIRARSAQPTT